MKKLIALLFTLLLVIPVMAQDEATPEVTAEATEETTAAEVTPANALPAGCNPSMLSDIFGSVSNMLAPAEVTAAQAVEFIDALDSTLSATRNACAGEIAVSTIDYSAIPQSRTADGAFVLGDPDAPITIVEFADFLCPHCQNYHSTVQDIITNYVATGQAKFEYRFFPVVDPEISVLTATMAECADILVPGNFWPAQDALYDMMTTEGFNSLSPFNFAARTGLDYDAMVSCLSEDAGQVLVDYDFGYNAGVTGTPTILVRYGDGDVERIKDSDGTEIPASSIPYMIISGVIENAQ